MGLLRSINSKLKDSAGFLETQEKSRRIFSGFCAQPTFGGLGYYEYIAEKNPKYAEWIAEGLGLEI